ncbi:hypothetical protein ABPG72_001600, partial [Tetrahymena utriculariae]
MKFIALLIITTLVASNASNTSPPVPPPNFPNTVPNWAISQAFTDYGNCAQIVMSTDPCKSSSNQSQCQANGKNYVDCWVSCFNQASYSSFRTCTNACDNALKNVDSNFNTFITQLD